MKNKFLRKLLGLGPFLLDKNKKPPEPYFFHKNGILLYTIQTWTWVERGTKMGKWTGFRILNYDHPTQRKKWEELQKKQKECLGSKKVDWEALEKFRITI